MWHAHAAMLPRASSLTHVRPRPLSRVFRRYLLLINNPALTCVALVQALIAAMYDYYGPTVTCQLYGAAGQAAVELPLIAASA